MSSWFRLNTTHKPPCWSPIGAKQSNFIEQLYANGEPRQLEPFYLPKITDSDDEARHRIRLLPDVSTRMALDCDSNHPLIYIAHSAQNRACFGYQITNTQQQQEEKDKDSKSKPRLKDHTLPQMTIDLWTQKIIFSNQIVREEQTDALERSSYKWYCLGIGAHKNRWYPFDTFTNQKMDENYYTAQILKEIGDRNRVIHKEEKQDDFVLHLLDTAYGSDAQWSQQQKQIRNHAFPTPLTYLGESEFAKQLTALTNHTLPVPQSTKLYHSLVQSGKQGNALHDDIIKTMNNYRRNKRDEMRSLCVKANLTQHSWTAKASAKKEDLLAFKLDEGTPCLDMRFVDNAFAVDIPFGFASISNHNEGGSDTDGKEKDEELLVIKWQFDFYGLMHDLHVSLYPFSDKPQPQTQNDCIKLCHVLYRILDGEAETNAYKKTLSVIESLHLDGCELYKWIQLGKKAFRQKMKDHALMKLNPASKLYTTLVRETASKYIYAYDTYDIAQVICTVSITVHAVIHECIVSNEKNTYTLHGIVKNVQQNDQLIGNMIHALKDAFMNNKKAKKLKNAVINRDDQQLIEQIKNELKYVQLSDALTDVIFGDKHDKHTQIYTYKKIESTFLNRKTALDTSNAGILHRRLQQCDIYLKEIRNEMVHMIQQQKHKQWLCFTSYLIHCYERARYKEISRVSDAIIRSKYDADLLESKHILDNDKQLEAFLTSEMGITMDKSNRFILKKIKVRLKNDINDWLCAVFYKEYEMKRLKEALRLLILNVNITSAKLDDMGCDKFTQIVRQQCGALMSIKLAHKLYNELPHEQNVSPKNCEEIYNQTILFMDKWWQAKKNKLKRRCIELDIDKQSFLSQWIPNPMNADKTWQMLHQDLKQIVQNEYDDPDDDDIDYDFRQLAITTRICTDNDIQRKSTTFGQWLLNMLEDGEEFMIKMDKLKAYLVGSKVSAQALHDATVKRKDFATECDRCDIPRGVSTKLHKELLKKTEEKEKRDMSPEQVYEYMKAYLETVVRDLKIKIIDRINRSKIGKYEFVDKYAYGGSESLAKIHDFLRTKVEFTKKDLLLKKMAHRIYICIGLGNEMYSLSNWFKEAKLTLFVDECDEYQPMLHRLLDMESSGADPKDSGGDKKDGKAHTQGMSHMNINPFLNIGIQKDIRRLIPEWIYTMEKTRDKIDKMKAYVLQNDMDSTEMFDMDKLNFRKLMRVQCDIAPGITTNFLNKVKDRNSLSPNQLVDAFSDYLHEFRMYKLQEIQEAIFRLHPIEDETEFIEKVLKNEETLAYLVTVYLRRYTKDIPGFTQMILTEISNREAMKHAQENANAAQAAPEADVEEKEQDFISRLVDTAYGSDREWARQQQAIRDRNFDLKRLKKTEFSKILTPLTNYTFPLSQSGKLYRVLLQSGKQGTALHDHVIKTATDFRKLKRDQLRELCEKANLNEDSFVSANDAKDFLTGTVKLNPKSRPVSNIMNTMFAATQKDQQRFRFTEWLCDVICDKNDLKNVIRRVTKYFKNMEINPSSFTRESSIQKLNQDFTNLFDAPQLYHHIKTTVTDLSGIVVEKLIEIATAYVTRRHQTERKMVFETCKKKKILQHTAFIETYGKSMDQLLSFLKDELNLKWSDDQLYLMQYKLNFYVNQSYPMNIFDDKTEFILWQSKLIWFAKIIKYVDGLTLCVKDKQYDADTLLAVNRKVFLSSAQEYDVISAGAIQFLREVKKVINKGDGTEVILSKLSNIVFTVFLTDKKFNTLAKKGEDKFLASVGDIKQNKVNEMVTKLKQSEFQKSTDRQADLLHEMNQCLTLMNMNRSTSSQDDDDEKKSPEIALDLQSLNQMNSRQIAFITCNVVMQEFVLKFENLRGVMSDKYKDIDGKELYKLVAENDDASLMRDVSKLDDVSAEQFALIACECLKADAKYCRKMMLLVTKIRQLNLDGRALFEKCLENEDSFVDAATSMMKFTDVPKDSMRTIWVLMFKNKLEWNQLTTDELMEYLSQMCPNNIRSIIMDTKLTGKRFVGMTGPAFLHNFTNHSFGCGLNKATLRTLNKTISTYSFDSDCKYKNFIENDLGFGNSPLAKLLISDFEKNPEQIKRMNNAELSRWISQYPVNQLYDILIFHEINNAEKLQTQLNSSLLDQVCGFSHYMDGEHSPQMIQQYWLKIAQNPKALLVNDLALIVQLVAFERKEKKNEKDVNEMLFKLDQHNKTMYHLLHYAEEMQSFLEEHKFHDLWQIFKSFSQMMKQRDRKFKRDWDEYEIASFILQSISEHVDKCKNTKTTLLRMNSHLFSPYEMLLVLIDFKPFIDYSIKEKLNARKLFTYDKKGELIRKLKENTVKRINDQTSDIYIIWIKEKFLRAEYKHIAKKARQIFGTHQKTRKQRVKLQKMISQIIKNKQLTFDRVRAMDEKEFIKVFGPQSDWKIYNERCCKCILKQIKNEKFDMDEKRSLKPNEQIQWFTNFRKDKIYHILYSNKFHWKYFSHLNDDKLSQFYDRILVLTQPESDRLFTLLHKEYLRRQSDAHDKRSDDDDAKDTGPDIIGLPAMFRSSDAPSDDITFYCDGSCHDGRDAIHFIQTSFGQLLLYLKHSELIQHETTSYNEIKQVWYDTMYKNDSKLFNQLDIIHDNTFDLILSQCIENDKISRVILSTLDAFQSSTFIKALRKYHLKSFITQYESTNQFTNNWTSGSCHQIIIAFLLKIIKNVHHVFEAKYLFYALLNASCKGHEEYEFEHEGWIPPAEYLESNEKYFTLEEKRNIEQYLSLFDYKRNIDATQSCASKYYLRSLLSAIIRVSNGIKKNKFSSIDNSKPKTIYLPITNREGRFNPKYNAITPTMRYKSSLYHEMGTEDEQNKSYILLRLQSSSSYFGTHFIDLHDVDVYSVFDGYLFTPFLIHQMAQTRLTVQDAADKSNDILQYQCTDVSGIYLDELCPFLTIQQYSNKYFVLFQMYYVLGHHKFMLLDNKYISSTNIDSHIFIERVQKQNQSELDAFLKHECNLDKAEIHKIMISTDRSTAYNLCVSNFLYIDHATLQSMGISAQSTRNISRVVREQRHQFFAEIESILFEEFADIESIRKSFTERKIGSFSDDIFYNPKDLEEFISDTKSRHLLLNSGHVMKGYFRKAYFNFIAAKSTLNALYENPFDTTHDLEQIFGMLCATFKKIKAKDMNAHIAREDEEEDNEDGEDKKEDEKTASEDSYYRRDKVNTTSKQRGNDFYNELLKGINQLTLTEEIFFDFVFLPNFKEINELKKLHQLLRTYFEMGGGGRRYVAMDKMVALKEVDEGAIKSQCFVMIAHHVIGYVAAAAEEEEKKENWNEAMQILNCPFDVFTSRLDRLRVYLNVDNKRCATLNSNDEECELSSTVDRFIASDKQQASIALSTFVCELQLECGAMSIQSRCCRDIEKGRSGDDECVSVCLTDPLDEWNNCSFCVYDIVELNVSSLCASWKRNHCCFGVDAAVYGIVSGIELADDVLQTQYHALIIDKLAELVRNDAIADMIGGDELNLDMICASQAFVWNIASTLKFTHRALQMVTIDWHTKRGEIIRGIYPSFGHVPFVRRVVEIPRVFDVIVYDHSLFYVYAIKLKPSNKEREDEPNIDLVIIRHAIGNNDDLIHNMMQIQYSRDTTSIVTATLFEWRISRHETIWYLPIYLNDFVIRPGTGYKQFAGKIVRIFVNDALNEKLPLVCVEVDWLIASPRAQTVFVWCGIGNILLNKQFKYSADYLIRNSLYLVSLECNDRVARGMDWNEALFDNQDGGEYLGKVSKVEMSPKGGYEVMVQWDHSNEEFNYRFGMASNFDVDIIQRRSKCCTSGLVPMFCGDRVVRSNCWKWQDQDAALGFGEDTAYTGIVTPQIGVVREIIVNPTTNIASNLATLKKVHHYIYNIPRGAQAVNQTLIVIDWIINRYASDMSEEDVFKQNENGFDVFERRHFDKYRYGYENRFDVTCVGQHSPLPMTPINKCTNLNHFYADYSLKHAINQKQQKDVLWHTHYQNKRYNNKKYDEQEKALVDQYEKELHRSKQKANRWPPCIVNKVNHNCKTFITRFVDANKFHNKTAL